MTTPDLAPLRLAITHWPHARGTAAEPQVRAWVEATLQLPAPLPVLPRDDYGRPRLDALLPGHDVNWSHGGTVLLAVLGQGVRVGCDVEASARQPRQPLALAQHYFDAATAAAITALPESDRAEAVLTQWCLREAVLKAHGRGLAFGLQRLHATWDTDGPRLLGCDAALGSPADWTLHAVHIPAHRAVVAVRDVS